MSGRITVVSCGLGPADLTPRHIEAIESADVLAGGDRLMGWFPEFKGARVTIGAHASEAAAELIGIANTQDVAVLASGDSLFFGIARLFVGKISPHNLVIIPNITAAQAALARLALPWHRARFFSVHGRKSTLRWRDILHAPVGIVYCDSKRPPSRIASVLVDAYPAAAERAAATVANLGTADEDIQYGTLRSLSTATCSGMSMLVLREPDASTMIPPLPLGQPDDAFLHENSPITHPEVRAVVLSKLGLRRGVLWDLGAGSGSVSIEASGICEYLQVFAVDQSPERCQQIQANATSAGRIRYRVQQGDALSVLSELPLPDSVFVGGGGRDLAAIVERAYAALKPGGSLVATAVLEESRAALVQALPTISREQVEIAVKRCKPLGNGTAMKPENPITIVTFRKPVV